MQPLVGDFLLPRAGGCSPSGTRDGREKPRPGRAHADTGARRPSAGAPRPQGPPRPAPTNQPAGTPGACRRGRGPPPTHGSPWLLPTSTHSTSSSTKTHLRSMPPPPPPPPRAAPATPDASPSASRRAPARPRGHMAAEPGPAGAGRGVEGKAGERRGGGGAARGEGADSAPAPPRSAGCGEPGGARRRGPAWEGGRPQPGPEAGGVVCAPHPPSAGGRLRLRHRGPEPPRASPADWAGWVGEGAGGEKEGRNGRTHGGERERADPAGRVPGFPRTQMCLRVRKCPKTVGVSWLHCRGFSSRLRLKMLAFPGRSGFSPPVGTGPRPHVAHSLPQPYKSEGGAGAPRPH